jgi:hypothetical protein
LHPKVVTWNAFTPSKTSRGGAAARPCLPSGLLAVSA